MDDLISRQKLLAQTAEWEAAALEHVGKLDPRNGPDEREEWVRWSAILQERTAFKYDVQDAPVAEPEQKTGRWIIDERPNIKWYRVTCSECGEDVTSRALVIGGEVAMNYCPGCGAKMENCDDND